MTNVIVRALAPGLDPDVTYHRISDFARYPELTAAVREVVVHAADEDASVVSEWEVHFRTGLLRWTERDTFDRAQRSIAFRQLTGDFAAFGGTWRVDDAVPGSLVTFDASFDLGIPTLAPILDPVAASTLRSNILLILEGLLGGVQALEDEVFVPSGA